MHESAPWRLFLPLLCNKLSYLEFMLWGELKLENYEGGFLIMNKFWLHITKTPAMT